MRSVSGQWCLSELYITAIILLYILSPYLKPVVDWADSVLKFVLIVVILTQVSYPFWFNYKLIMATRLLIYVIGMFCCKFICEDRSLSSAQIVALIITFLAGTALLFYFHRRYVDYLWTKGLYWLMPLS